MRNHPHHTHGRFATVVIVASLEVFAMSGCDDDTGLGRSIDLANSWPNDDGRYWVFEEHTILWTDSLGAARYPNPGDVPPAPTLDEVVALLQQPLDDYPLGSQLRTFRLQFNGMTTTLSGATGQNLQGWIDDAPIAMANAGNRADSQGETRQGEPVSSGFLAQLRQARPDLWSNPAWPAVRTDPWDPVEPIPPTFLPSGAWEKTDAYIGHYGDLDLDLGWKYLEADLDVGHEFVFQLIPSLANDVYLHARVHASRTIETQNGVYDHALEVIYMVDFGILQGLNSYSRTFSISRVVYVADVGPVWSEERNLYVVGATTPTGPYVTVTLDLQGTGQPAMAARR